MSVAVGQREQFLRLLPGEPVAHAIPTLGCSLHIVDRRSVSAGMKPAMTAARVRAQLGRYVLKTFEEEKGAAFVLPQLPCPRSP